MDGKCVFAPWCQVTGGPTNEALTEQLGVKEEALQHATVLWAVIIWSDAKLLFMGLSLLFFWIMNTWKCCFDLLFTLVCVAKKPNVCSISAGKMRLTNLLIFKAAIDLTTKAPDMHYIHGLTVWMHKESHDDRQTHTHTPLRPQDHLEQPKFAPIPQLPLLLSPNQ